jgi:hypothetical protein
MTEPFNHLLASNPIAIAALFRTESQRRGGGGPVC